MGLLNFLWTLGSLDVLKIVGFPRNARASGLLVTILSGYLGCGDSPILGLLIPQKPLIIPNHLHVFESDIRMMGFVECKIILALTVVISSRCRNVGNFGRTSVTGIS